MTYTISKLAKLFNLSRSTLLYYDKKGLLKPSARTANNYRLYTESDYRRLQNIITWREAGLSLEDIATLLEYSNSSKIKALLADQVQHLNAKIKALRQQQLTTLSLLKSVDETSSDTNAEDARSDDTRTESRVMNKQQWVNLLAASGMSDDDMWKWHQEFERLMPEAHQDFLESLQISDAEIKQIRRKSRKTRV